MLFWSAAMVSGDTVTRPSPRSASGTPASTASWSFSSTTASGFFEQSSHQGRVEGGPEDSAGTQHRGAPPRGASSTQTGLHPRQEPRPQSR